MRENNFDILRHVLAFSVFIYHYMVLSSVDAVSYLFSADLAVKAFFVISGMLVWMSALRNGFGAYLLKRVLRLYPALASVLVLCVVIFILMGAEVGEAVRYFFWNILLLNFIHPCVGELFRENKMCAVNGSLWTLKVEVGFYVICALVVFLGGKFRTKILLFLTVASLLGETYLLFFSDLGGMADVLVNQIFFKFHYFAIPVLLFLRYGELNRFWLLVVFSASLLLYSTFRISFVVEILLVISFVFLVGFHLPFKINCRWGDYSYGIYIFHFPIIQLFLSYRWFDSDRYVQFAIISVALLAFSGLSWNFVERKCLIHTPRSAKT